MEQKPSIGRVVHYHWEDSSGLYCRAAIITEVKNTVSTDVSLAVMFPHGQAFYEDVEFDDNQGRKPGTWHWPERV